jgi:serine/threonine protein kinase
VGRDPFIGVGMVGTTISHYRVLRKLDSGGMGVVYEAEDLRLRRHVALKFLPDDVRPSQSGLHRLKREARAASVLNHPHICTVYEIEEYESRCFIVMELLDGCTLRQRINGHPLPARTLLQFAIQIADALDAVHREKMIHRDLKPGNIFVTCRDQIKLLDFGLAKNVYSHVERLAVGSTGPTLSCYTVTRPGGIPAGTVGYMSPEQARGEDIDHRSDLFSFGAVLYEMATGKPAFTGQRPP